MAEKLSAKRVSLSLAAVSGIISIVCAVLIAIVPETTTKLLGEIFHGIDVSQIMKTLTISGVIFGTIEVVVIALIAGWLFAKIYNSIKN